jgi:branched-chain amino acid aminotransferase
VNGVEIGLKGQIWGPVTQRVAEAYRRLVDHDFVGQYLKHYVEGAKSRAF